MRDDRKTETQLVEEISELRRRIARLEESQQQFEDSREALRLFRGEVLQGIQDKPRLDRDQHHERRPMPGRQQRRPRNDRL